MAKDIVDSALITALDLNLQMIMYTFKAGHELLKPSTIVMADEAIK